MRIGACWLKEKDGEKYFSGVISLPFIGKINFAIFKNKEKKNNEPDYNIVWSEPREQNSAASKTSGPNPFEDELAF